MSTPDSSATPETTASPVSTEVSTETVKESVQVSPAKILEGVHNLCNTSLYVLHHAYYRGEDAHLVLQAKEFIKEIRKDVENKQKDIAAGKQVNLA